MLAEASNIVAAIDWESAVPFIVGTVTAAAIIAVAGLLWRGTLVMFRIADRVETIAPYFEDQTPEQIARGDVNQSLPATVARLVPAVSAQGQELSSHLIAEGAETREIKADISQLKGDVGDIKTTVNVAIERLDTVVEEMTKAATADGVANLDMGQEQIASTARAIREHQSDTPEVQP